MSLRIKFLPLYIAIFCLSLPIAQCLILIKIVCIGLTRGGHRFGRQLSRLTDFCRNAVGEFISVKRLIGGRFKSVKRLIGGRLSR